MKSVFAVVACLFLSTVSINCHAMDEAEGEELDARTQAKIFVYKAEPDRAVVAGQEKLIDLYLEMEEEKIKLEKTGRSSSEKKIEKMKTEMKETLRDFDETIQKATRSASKAVEKWDKKLEKMDSQLEKARNDKERDQLDAAIVAGEGKQEKPKAYVNAYEDILSSQKFWLTEGRKREKGLVANVGRQFRNISYKTLDGGTAKTDDLTSQSPFFVTFFYLENRGSIDAAKETVEAARELGDKGWKAVLLCIDGTPESIKEALGRAATEAVVGTISLEDAIEKYRLPMVPTTCFMDGTGMHRVSIVGGTSKLASIAKDISDLEKESKD